MSILVRFGFDCIQQFPLDYMHLVCLGVVKRLLLVWKEGSRPFKLSAGQLLVISDSLSNMKGKFPSEFARQPRGIEEVRKWKATEFRQFLLYTGPIILKNILAKQYYEHFLSLSLAFRILLHSDDIKREHLKGYANDLLRYFVGKARELYGDTFTVYNVHSLIHICSDMEYFQCSLDEISAFPFENHLQVFKKIIRKSQNPLGQIIRRVAELDNHCVKLCSKKNF